jgi:hypothetical protein
MDSAYQREDIEADDASITFTVHRRDILNDILLHTKFKKRIRKRKKRIGEEISLWIFWSFSLLGFIVTVSNPSKHIETFGFLAFSFPILSLALILRYCILLPISLAAKRTPSNAILKVSKNNNGLIFTSPIGGRLFFNSSTGFIIIERKKCWILRDGDSPLVAIPKATVPVEWIEFAKKSDGPPPIEFTTNPLRGSTKEADKKMPKSTSRKALYIFCFFAVSLLVVTFSLVETVPPENLLFGEFANIEMRTKYFYQQYKKIPQSLDELPLLPGKDNSALDAKGNKILFSVREDRIVISGMADKYMSYSFSLESVYQNQIHTLKPEPITPTPESQSNAE